MRTRPFLLALLPLLAGCSFLGGEDPAYGPVPTPLVVSMVNPGTGRPPESHLRVLTEYGYGCAGYQVVLARRSPSAGVVEVEAKGIVHPGEVCATVVLPAVGVVPLGLPDGTHELRLTLGDRTDVYRLVLGPHGATLEPVATTFSRAA